MGGREGGTTSRTRGHGGTRGEGGTRGADGADGTGEGRGVAGVDEAGRGPVLGPLVASAVLVDEADAGLADLVRDGLRDSKRLTPSTREVMAARVRDVADVEVKAVSAEAIDRARTVEGRTLNDVEVALFAGLLRKAAPRTAYVDAADVDAERFGREIHRRLDGRSARRVCGPAPHIVAEHGADDRYPVVAAASVVAKVERDRRMAAIAEELGGDAGSGYPSDPATVAFLRRWVRDHGELPPHTRRSWKSAARLLAEADQRSLADY